MNTEACKRFIVEKLALSPVLREELWCHEADSWDESKWRRSEKRKIRDEGAYEWLRYVPEDMGESVAVDQMLTGCTVRMFLHVQCDSCVGIVTDPKDEKIVGWMFQID